jgi:hypothetical protein
MRFTVLIWIDEECHEKRDFEDYESAVAFVHNHGTEYPITLIDELADITWRTN